MKIGDKVRIKETAEITAGIDEMKEHLGKEGEVIRIVECFDGAVVRVLVDNDWWAWNAEDAEVIE